MIEERQVQRGCYDFLIFQFLFGFGAGGRAVSVLSRCSRSRAVFASRAARSTSINSRAASDVRSFLSCFSLSVNACLSRIDLPDPTAQRFVAAPNYCRQIGFHPEAKKQPPPPTRATSIPKAHERDRAFVQSIFT
ncbi:hypothetical protein [Mesorhizobium sp.]|uniref:hypothetical protein n=1 Tax=Mesorhizobium sp. TaxID=1871066 RepID=UPI00257A1F36|nr:hypothetical protein [Mesorhizobium sp.]